MDKLLSQKTAIITGGTRGIGKAIAKSFLLEGASCILIGTSEEAGQRVIEEFQEACKEGSRVSFYALDVANFSQVENVFHQIMEKFGPIDILVNNAGITRDNLLMRISEEDWDKVLDTNLKSIYNACRAVVRPMMKARKGKIINITSVVGLIGNAGQTNYAASKAGMIGFTKSLAKEIGSRNICVNCIAPGFIKSAMTENLPEALQKDYLKQIPMQRFGNPEDVANAAVFLASPLSDYITGQVITVDGGMVMF